MNTAWLHRNLILGSHQIYFGKNRGSLKGGCKVLDMWDWIAVGFGDVVQCSIVTAQMPISRLFTTMQSGDDQLLDEGRMIPNSNICSNSCQAILSRSGASLRWHTLTGGPVMFIRCVMSCFIR